MWATGSDQLRSPPQRRRTGPVLVTTLLLFFSLNARAPAQVEPTPVEVQNYTGLHAAAAKGDWTAIERLVRAKTPIDARDTRDRTPLHVAVFMHQQDAARTLLRLGADANALETQQYDIVTIAAVANDVPMLKLALQGGCRATNITSPYRGTALIAAAHLGHDEVVRTLIAAKAPLDHVNNLGWTAVIESIVLGDGGKRHVATLKALVDAGANVNLADRSGDTPLKLASKRGYTEMVAILTAAGAR
jgi:ankyrin repeat protein